LKERGPTPLPSPRVELENSPLTRHRSTFSASSKDLARHKGGEYIVKKIITVNGNLSLPKRGEYIVKKIITVNGNLSLPLREGRGGVQK
jgi:hypothetical protein